MNLHVQGVFNTPENVLFQALGSKTGPEVQIVLLAGNEFDATAQPQ
jgi:hypothetical protein